MVQYIVDVRPLLQESGVGVGAALVRRGQVRGPTGLITIQQTNNPQSLEKQIKKKSFKYI